MCPGGGLRVVILAEMSRTNFFTISASNTEADSNQDVVSAAASSPFIMVCSSSRDTSPDCGTIENLAPGSNRSVDATLNAAAGAARAPFAEPYGVRYVSFEMDRVDEPTHVPSVEGPP